MAAGTVWIDVGSKIPTSGKEISCDKLEAGLKAGKTESNKDELESFGVRRELERHHRHGHQSFIKVGETYYKPAANLLECLDTGTIRLLSTSWLLKQSKDYVLPRCQDLLLNEKEAFVAPEKAAQLLRASRVCALSYRCAPLPRTAQHVAASSHLASLTHVAHLLWLVPGTQVARQVPSR